MKRATDDDSDDNCIHVFDGECFGCETEAHLINVVNVEGTDIHLCRDCILRAFAVSTPDSSAN